MLSCESYLTNLGDAKLGKVAYDEIDLKATNIR